MAVFDQPDFAGHEDVVFATDPASGLRTIIALHSTALGPASGGCRMYPYADDAAALTDALRLSRGMSFKNAMADLPLGGGKAVIIGDPKAQKTEALLRAFAAEVEKLGGRYITAMDVGMTEADMGVFASVTRHVAGYAQAGKEGGDPSPMTALGIFAGIKAAVRAAFKTDDLKGLRVAVQGLGKVGYDTAVYLHAAGAELIVADVNAAAVARAQKELSATAVAPADILRADADVLSPCALGAVLNDETIPALKVRIVAGGANNQLARDRHGAMLRDRGILYAPDYVINGGGIIRVCAQLIGQSDAWARAKTENIAATLSAIFAEAARTGEPTNVIADRMATARIAPARPLRAAAE